MSYSVRMAGGILAMGGCIAWHAAIGEPLPLTLDDCLQAALQDHPEVVMARLAVLMGREDISAAESVYDTVLRAEGQYEDAELPRGGMPFFGPTQSTLAGASLARAWPLGTVLSAGVDTYRIRYSDESGLPFASDTGSGLMYVSATQPLWRNAWGRVNRAQVDASFERYKAAQYRLEEIRQAVAVLIHALYWDAYAAQRGLEANARALASSRRLLAIHQERASDFLMDEIDVLAAEAALASREAEWIGRKQVAASAKDRLCEAIGWPPDTWDRVVLPFPEADSDRADLPEIEWSLDDWMTEALLQRPELEVIRREQDALDADIEAARQAVRPGLAVTATYGVGDTAESFGDHWGTERSLWTVGVQFDFPLERRAEKSRLAQSRWRRVQWDAEYERRVRMVSGEVREAARRVETTRKQWLALRAARDAHAAKERLEEEKLRQGRGSTQWVVRYQEEWAWAESALIQAMAEWKKAQATLRYARGVMVPVEGRTP